MVGLRTTAVVTVRNGHDPALGCPESWGAQQFLGGTACIVFPGTENDTAKPLVERHRDVRLAREDGSLHRNCAIRRLVWEAMAGDRNQCWTGLQRLRREAAPWSVMGFAPEPWLAFTSWWVGRFCDIYYWSESVRARRLGLAPQRIPIHHLVSGVRVASPAAVPASDEVSGHAARCAGRAITGGCLVASQLKHLLADARAEPDRSVAVGLADIAGSSLLVLLALRFQSSDVWIIAVAVAVAGVLLSRVLGQLGHAMAVERRP
jgi:hypothetical protein